MQERLIENLSKKRLGKRVRAYNKLIKADEKPQGVFTEKENFNFQIRTGYSCFDRSPSLAVYWAHKFGLPIVSLVDFASLASAKELQKTAEPSGIAFYSGAEVTLSCEFTANKTLKALAIGIPRKHVKQFHADLEPYRALRLDHVKGVAEKINLAFKGYGIKISPTEKVSFGGIKTSIDIRGLFVNLAEAIIKKFGSESAIIEFLTQKLKYDLSDEDIAKLEDFSSPLYLEDLSHIIYSHFKIKETEKCKPVKQFTALSDAHGAIAAAIFQGGAGEVEDFVKKAKAAGFKAVMAEHENIGPIAETLYEKCIENDMLPLCRSVIDYARSKFDAKFSSEDIAEKYNECAYAVVGHEISTTLNFDDGLFSKESVAVSPNLSDRITLYSHIGYKGKLN